MPKVNPLFDLLHFPSIFARGAEGLTLYFWAPMGATESQI